MNQHQKIPTKQHADASPSAGGTWTQCAASVTRARGSSSCLHLLREGSAAHELAERLLKEEPLVASVVIEGEEVEITEEMLENVWSYVDHVQAFEDVASIFGIEERVSLEDLPEPIFGTLDAFGYDPVTNASTSPTSSMGRATRSRSRGTSRLPIYALGLLRKLGPFVEVEKIRMAIVQPRVSGPPVKIETIPLQELLDWERDVLLPAVQRIADNDGTEVAGDHCKWCVRAGECKAFATLASAKAGVVFGAAPPPVDHLTNEDLADILEHAETISAWVSKVRGEASQRLDVGQAIPGWKLVPKRAMRRWDAPAVVLDALVKRGVPWDKIAEILSPLQVEKVAKGYGVTEKDLAPMVIKESSGSTLARASNSRKALDNDAGSVFSEVSDL